MSQEAPKKLVPETIEPELIPKTRAEAHEQNKKKYLPAERLAIQLHKQLKKEKQKKDKLNDMERELDERDINKLTESMRRIMEILV